MMMPADAVVTVDVDDYMQKDTHETQRWILNEAALG
jgi:hypothetical protein